MTHIVITIHPIQYIHPKIQFLNSDLTNFYSSNYLDNTLPICYMHIFQSISLEIYNMQNGVIRQFIYLYLWTRLFKSTHGCLYFIMSSV